MSDPKGGRRFDTIAIHAGQRPDPTTGAVMTPIYLSSTYAQEAPGRHKGYEYSRTHNLTRFALEDNLAALEGGKNGLAFASGCAATTTVLHLLRAGDHVIAGDDLYGGTYRIFEHVFRPLKVDFTYVDPRGGGDAFAAQVRDSTKLVWMETPTNPLLRLCDISEIAKAVKERRSEIIIAVDNTFMTPYNQRPLALGADLVVHSTTKYLNGHSDVIGGAVITSDSDLNERLRFLQNSIGAVPSPMDCFLVLRGIKTLHLRMDRHERNAVEIATWLQQQPGVESVVYPGLPSHPQHALAKRQQSGFGGMIAFEIEGGMAQAAAFLSACRIFACAESLGGVESLIEHPAIMTHASVPEKVRRALGIGDRLIRISVGCEDADDLKDDLNQALQSALALR